MKQKSNVKSTVGKFNWRGQSAFHHAIFANRPVLVN